MNQRSIDLGVILNGHLASLGPTAHALAVHKMEQWTFVRIAVATDDALRVLAEDLGLAQARIQRRGRIWWCEVSSRGDGLLVVAAGPVHSSDAPEQTP